MTASSLAFTDEATAWLATADRVLAPTYTRPELLLVDGVNATLKDSSGRTYLDMTSGIAVTSLGHRSTVVTEALQTAAKNLGHVSNLFHTQAPIELAQALVEHSFADRVFFCNSGAEAVEGAIKFARLSHDDRRKILYFGDAFHGRTFGALAATDKAPIRSPFEPLPAGFSCIDAFDQEALSQVDDTTAAVIIEPVQGEGGIQEPPDGFLRALRERCDQVDALLIFDEIQCGLGRTGTLWAHGPSQVTPDLMTLAKPLANGLPIGAILMSEKVASSLYPGCHGTTFGGGPTVTYVARAVFNTLRDPTFLEQVQAKGELLKKHLHAIAHPAIVAVRGRGLMVGVQIESHLSEVVDAARRRGLLLVGAAHSTVRFLPPLTISEHEIVEAVKLFESALVEVFA